MKKFLLLLFFGHFTYTSFSQHFILDKRSKIKKNMEQFYAENNRKYDFTETDSTITYVLNDSLSLPATTVFYFNQQNRCIKQENIFSCDSCLQQSMQRSLAEKFVSWDKITQGAYYAGFPYNTLMEQIKFNDRFILRFTKQKRKDVKHNGG